MTITLTREEAQQVLDALEKISMGGHPDWADDVIPLLRARLSAPEPPCKTGSQCIGGKCPQCVVSEPEPVAWLYVEGLEALKAGKCWTAYGTKQDDDCRFPVYTAPPQQEWQDLTMAETKTLWNATKKPSEFAVLISAKLKEKNT